MKTKHSAIILSVLCVLLAACGPSPAEDPTAPAAASKYIVAGRFEAYYSEHGGLQTLGLAISPEISEGALVYQYFENGRLEYNPAAAPGAEVALSPLGLEFALEDPPATASTEPGALCYVETGHCITAFRQYFEEHGGIHFFGYPISSMKVDMNRLVQQFERATLVWDQDLPEGNRIQMAPLGMLKCAQVDCRAPAVIAGQLSDSAADGVVASAPDASVPFAEFVNRHGGTAVFGNALSQPAPGDDGAIEQYYDNAVLYLDPAAPEGVRMRALGVTRRPIDPPTVPMADPEAYFDATTGHNVLFEFRDYFDQMGGVYVLGSPLAEMDFEGGMMVQYFENGRLEWHGGAAPGERVRLSPLGAEEYDAAPEDKRPEVLEAQRLEAQIWATTPILSVGQPQTINVRVSDERGNLLAGAIVQVTVDTTGSPMAYGLAPTDAAGYTSLTFTLPTWEPGRFVLYSVQVEYGTLEPITLEDQFIQWHGALPTAMPAP
jgi:hypothetical protein